MAISEHLETENLNNLEKLSKQILKNTKGSEFTITALHSLVLKFHVAIKRHTQVFDFCHLVVTLCGECTNFLLERCDFHHPVVGKCSNLLLVCCDFCCPVVEKCTNFSMNAPFCCSIVCFALSTGWARNTFLVQRRATSVSCCSSVTVSWLAVMAAPCLSSAVCRDSCGIVVGSQQWTW